MNTVSEYSERECKHVKRCAVSRNATHEVNLLMCMTARILKLSCPLRTHGDNTMQRNKPSSQHDLFVSIWGPAKSCPKQRGHAHGTLSVSERSESVEEILNLLVDNLTSKES